MIGCGRFEYQRFSFQQHPPLQCGKRCLHSSSIRSTRRQEPPPIGDCSINKEYLMSILDKKRNSTTGMNYRQALFNVKLQKTDFPRVLELARRFGIKTNDPHHRCRACGKTCGKTVDAHSTKSSGTVLENEAPTLMRKRDLTIPLDLRMMDLIEDVFRCASNIACSEVTEDSGLPYIEMALRPGRPGFLLPREDLQRIKDAALRHLGGGGGHLFVRAPIGAGKSTIVATLARDPRVIRVSFTIGTPPCQELCNILGLSETTHCPTIIHPLLDGKMLVLDECHLAFHDEGLLD